MMKKAVFSWCVVAASCFSVVSLSPTISVADTKENAGAESLVKKAEKLQSLVAGAKAKGADVSEALKLDQKSREAAGKNDFASANKLLDEAIKALEAQTAKNVGNVEPVSSVSLMKKAEKLLALVAGAKAKGTDVSEALKLDQKSREAAAKSDFASADKLLDEAIKALEAPATQKTGSTETTSAKQDAPSTGNEEPVSSVSLMKKAEELHTLIAGAKAKDVDVSEALKLDQQSRDAAGKGDFASANRLLDEAIKALSAPVAQKTEKTESSSSASSAKQDAKETESKETASSESSTEQDEEESEDAEAASSESSTKQDAKKAETTESTSGESSTKKTE